MMRGPTYDDNYIARKMNSLAPTFVPPVRDPSGYMQCDTTEDCCTISEEPSSLYTSKYAYTPSARTRLILNRVSLTPQARSYVPPPRLPPRMAPQPPAYYDDYYGGYGGHSQYSGGYGYGGGYYPPPPLPRYNVYNPYMDDDYDVNYTPRYRPSRFADSIVEMEKEKQLRRSLSPSRYPVSSTEVTTTTSPPSDFLAKHYSPVMLQDTVDNMRMRLKAMSFSLDPSGPVPEIIIPERSRRVDGAEMKKRYSSGPRHLACVEYAGQNPQWKRKARARYPSEDPNKLSEISKAELLDAEDAAEKDPEKLVLKDRLSMKIHKYLCDSLTPDQFESYLKTYRNPGTSTHSTYSLPNYTSRYASAKGSESAKWEEPDKVYATSTTTERKPFSKIAEEDETKLERSKKKKSKERDDFEETSAAASSAAASEPTADATEGQVSATNAENVAISAEADTEMDEKERKRMEKKKRKAEREVAAKAAMEAELTALAAAEAELAKLEAESANMKPSKEAKASEKPAEKCESQFESREFDECEPSSFVDNLQEQHEKDLSSEAVLDEPVQPEENETVQEEKETYQQEKEPQVEYQDVDLEEPKVSYEEQDVLAPGSSDDAESALGAEQSLEQQEDVEQEVEQPGDEEPVETEAQEQVELEEQSTEHQDELLEQPVDTQEDYVEHPEEIPEQTQDTHEDYVEKTEDYVEDPEDNYQEKTEESNGPVVRSEYFFE